MINSLRKAATLHILFRQHPLSRDRMGAAFLAFLKHQIRVRLQGEVIYPWVGDSKLAIRKWMPGATFNVYSGLLEFGDMGFALHFLRPTDIFFDVGANVGAYAVLASKVCGSRSLCFEPDPTIEVHLRRNLEVNAIADRVEVLPYAVGAQRGEAKFSVGLDVLNSFVEDDSVQSRIVQVVRLDDFADRAPALVKIDVEGFEEGVVEGAEGVLAQDNLQAVLVENATPRIVHALERHGFGQAYYDPRGRRLSREPGELRSHNSLFLKDLDFCLERVSTAAPFRVLGTSY
jgi:FkbM family methyltransferase